MEKIIVSTDSIIVEQTDNIAILTLNNPKNLNAFTMKFLSEFYEILTQISNKNDTQVVVLKAEGKIFSAGASMDLLKSSDTPYKVKKNITVLNNIMKTIYEMPQPIICAIDGASVGGGANLALSCDFVIASTKAKFGNVFINLGIMPDTGGLWNLCRLVGPMRAKEIAMRGLNISAQEALDYGLITKIVTSETLYDEVMYLAKDLASMPRFALSSIKSICYRVPYWSYDTYREVEEGLMGIMFSTNDFKEGVNAFLEKRKPIFTGDEEI